MQPAIVFNSQLYNNPYQRLLYCALRHRYVPVKGSAVLALDALKRERPTLFHIHWEEGLFRGAATKQDGRNLARRFVRNLRDYIDAGGKSVWTIHNARPHGRGHHGAFEHLRRELAPLVDVILVHNEASAQLLKDALGSDVRSIKILPHPSYAGTYLRGSHTSAEAVSSGQVLMFGRVQPYKRLHEVFDALPPSFTELNQLSIVIKGDATGADAYASKLTDIGSIRPDVSCDFGHVNDADVAPTFERAMCALILYENALTSGVAVLALSLGVPVVAPRLPHMVELIPLEGQDLLFEPGSVEDLQRALVQCRGWSTQRRREFQAAAARWAHTVRPYAISRALGEVYDSLVRKAAT